MNSFLKILEPVIKPNTSRPAEGHAAPDFTGVDQNGEPICLQDFKGKNLILFFYPKDNTPTCTVEACNFRDHYSDLQTKGFEVVGVSPDGQKSHTRFIEKHQLPYRLIADPDLKMVNDYGVWVEKTNFGRTYMGTARTTFVVNQEGIITHVIDDVKSKEAAGQVLERYYGQAIDL